MTAGSAATGPEAESRHVPFLETFFATPRAAGHSTRSIKLLLAFGVMSSVISVLPPLIFGEVIDAVVRGLNTGGWTGIARSAGVPLALFAGVSLVGDLLRIGYGFSVTQYTNRLVGDIKLAVGSAALDADPRVRNSERSQLSYLVSVDSAQLPSLYSVPMTTVLSDLFDSALIILIVLAVDWRLAIILILPIPPMYLIAKRAGMRQNLLARNTRAAESEINDHVDHIGSAWLTILVFGGRDREVNTLNGLRRRALDQSRSATANLAGMMAQLSLIRIVVSVLLIGVAAWLAGSGAIAVGSVATVMLYLSRFYSPAINLSKSYQAVQRGLVSADRLRAFVEGQQTWPSTPAGRDSQPPGDGEETRLSARHVVLDLADGGRINIPDFSIHRAGLILVTGPSGSGKSTLLRSLLGLGAPPAKGAFEVNGQSLELYDATERFALFSYADQDNSLLRGSAIDCVTYPIRDDPEEAGRGMRALSGVGLTSLASRRIGATENAVSGGEARRIVLARALARPSPILIADEATSNLDKESRALVETALLAESRRRIVLLAVHDPGTMLTEAASAVVEFTDPKTLE
ncbi:ABC transporter ATP-binding protein [Actinoplanes sp. NPDC026619]|uniref:ABC transporter ATP-binding protein n=1 Tax=Actinoplanes sp. NPDC026619 TaxID=3155798 RepID=UPI003404CA93